MSINRNVTVVIPDNTVVIDGVGYACPGLPVQPEGLHAIHWRPLAPALVVRDGKTYRGNLEWVGKPDEPKWFDDFGRLDVYVQAWERQKAEAEKRVATQKAEQERIKREAEAQMAAAKVEMERQKAQLEQMRPYHEALAALGDTDHEVIKAAEAGVPVDRELVQKRQGWRATARSEKQKLQAMGILK